MSDELKPFYKAFRVADVKVVHSMVEAGIELAGATFKNMTTGGFDLREAKFGNTEFEDSVLSRVNFAEADLAGAYMHGTTLVECDMSDADLDGAAFEGCVFKDCNFTGANLDATEMTGCEFDGCTISDVTLEGAAWESITVNGGKVEKISGAGEWTSVVMRDTEFGELDTSAMTLNRCTTNATPVPGGFEALSGRRTRIG